MLLLQYHESSPLHGRFMSDNLRQKYSTYVLEPEGFVHLLVNKFGWTREVADKVISSLATNCV